MARETGVAETLIENVSDTAFWVAHYRGLEGKRDDALFRDPLAAALAGERGRRIAQSIPGSFFTVLDGRGPDLHHRRLYSLRARQGVDTVVNLGAGLDTRPYRMELPASLAWIEVDYPAVIAVKETQLAHETPRCQLTRVKLDLADAAARRAMLADINGRATKMLILTEGVVPYLTPEDVGSLADDLRTLGRAVYWIVDYFTAEVVKRRQSMFAKKMRNAPFKFYPQDWFAFFAEHGWRCKELRYLAEEADRLHRPLRLPLIPRLVIELMRLYASKERIAAFRKYAGYALLEPACHA